MSRKDEDRILHGLYYYRESIDEEFTASSDQILWLAAHSYVEGTGWYKDDDLQSFDSSVVPLEFRKKLLMSKFELPLRYLHYRRLIKLARAGDEMVDVSVTFAGADRAIRLHTLPGRMEVWYQERKDGFLGLVTTAIVSLITALLTVYVAERVRHSVDEPPRVIYEIMPKASPSP
jgi:hypothetical protein